MRVLVIQNYQNTGLGQVRRALEEAGAEIDTREVFAGDALPQSAEGYDALIALGGAQNALDDEKYPYIPALLDLIREFQERDRSVLGICLGSQLVARAYGGANIIGGAPEFGWRRIALTDDAREDAVLGSLPADFPIFQWHDDTFTLPEGAIRLASSDAAANQAFRIGRATYGMQFHFEADRALVDQWNVVAAETIAARHPDWPERHPKDAATYGPEADATGLAIARAWVATI